MPRGRPKITLDKLPENWKEKMLELAEHGASDVELRVRALDNICHETWVRLKNEEKEFSETIKKCHALTQVWWERAGREGIFAEKFNSTPWVFNMKNRFGWRDKTEISGDSENPLYIESSLSGDSIRVLEGMGIKIDTDDETSDDE